MFFKRSRVCVVVFALGLIVASTSVQAALMTWQTPVTISGDSDVSTVGTLDRAYLLGGAYGVTTAAATANGVTFQPFQGWTNHGFGPVRQTWTVGQTTLGDSSGSLYLDGGTNTSASAPFANLSSSYQSILANEAFNDNADWSLLSPLKLTLNGLTIGQEYLFETWVSDPRAASGSRSERVTSGGALSGVLYFNASASDGGLGQYLIGTFTADATSQVVTYSAYVGGLAQVNAFQLRSVSTPEPGTLGLLATGLMGLLAYAWRKRK